MIDFKGNELCENCWKGHHYVYETNTKTKKPINSRPLANCLRGGCKCLCVARLEDLKLGKLRIGLRIYQLMEEAKLQSMLFGDPDE